MSRRYPPPSPALSSASSRSLLSWLEGVEPYDSGSLDATRDKRKLDSTDFATDGKVEFKRRQSARIRDQQIGRVRRPLAKTSGNIMPPKQPVSPQKPDLRSRQPLRHPPVSQARLGQQERLQEEEEEEEQEETPRPIRSVVLPPPTASDESDEVERVSSHSEESSRCSGTSKRSSSPVKNLADLQFAEVPTDYEVLDGNVAKRCKGFLDHYMELQDASYGIGVIPLSLKPFIESTLHVLDRPRPHAYTRATEKKSDKVFIEYERAMGQEALEIHRKAHNCEKEALPEPSWDAEVYDPLLNLVLRHPKFNGALKCVNITTARISPQSLAMNHSSGAAMQTKMVDFGICLNPSDDLRNRIRKHLAPLNAKYQSINQTRMASIRMTPIAISFETKIPFQGGQASDVQQAIWVGAAFARLRQIISSSHPGVPRKKLPLLPALSAHGHHLDLVAFEEQGNRNVMYGKLAMGSSYTLLGVFQMIRGIEILANWAHLEYRTWFTEQALT